MKYLKFELKSLFKKYVIAVMIFACVVSIPFLIKGTHKYNQTLQHSLEFQKVEIISAQKNLEYIKRGLKGPYTFSLMAQPSPAFILFHDAATFNALQATIDCTGVNLKLYSPIGNETCDSSSGLNFDFKTYLLIVSIFGVSIFGFLCSSSKRRLKFLKRTYSPKTIYFISLLAKFIYILSAMIILYGLVFLAFLINGIEITGAEAANISLYFLTMLVLQLWLLASASLAGILKHKFVGAMAIIAVWIISIIFLNGIVLPSQDSTSQYRLALQKNNLFTNFEDYTFKKIKDVKDTDREKFYDELLKEYHANLKKIKDLEAGIIDKTEKTIAEGQLAGIFLPLTYQSVCSGEMSSMGYGAYLELYKAVDEIQYKLAKFYIDKIYEGRTGKLKETKEADDFKIDCVFKMKSRLPGHFFKGLILQTALIILFFFLVYFPFKRMLSPRIKYSFKNLKIALKKGEYVLLFICDGFKDFADKLFNIVFNKSEKFDGEINIDGEPLADKKVFYLPELTAEDIKPLALLSGGTIPAKPFKEYNFKDICELFPQIRECDVLLLDNVSLKLEPQKGITIIDMNPEIVDRKHTRLFRLMREEAGYTLKREHKKE